MLRKCPGRVASFGPTAVFIALCATYLLANRPGLSPNYRNIPGAAKYVFLTFDAHPCMNTLLHKCNDLPAISGAWQLLATLRANKVHCTFFFTGEFIDAYPDLVRQAIRDGHEIGSHLKTHTHPLEFQQKGIRFSRKWFLDELLSADRALIRTGNGHAAKLFRMPYGIGSYLSIPDGPRLILQWANEAGYTHVDWSVDTLDWISREGASRTPFLPPYLTSRQMEEVIFSNRGNGSIILSHLTRYRPLSEPSVNEMLPDLLNRLSRQQIKTARISDFLARVPEQIPAAQSTPESSPQKPDRSVANRPAHTPPATRPGSPTRSSTTPASPENAIREPATCNFYWRLKNVHICMQGLSDRDCSAFEGDPFFSREETCPCTKGSTRYELENLGELVQISCKL